MNTTESDINIDTEEVHEVVTTDLNGEKIERLLYQAGLDAEYKIGPEGIPVLVVQAGDVSILLSEPWEADGTWYIDPETVVLDKIVDGDNIDTVFPVITTEGELVDSIEDFLAQ